MNQNPAVASQTVKKRKIKTKAKLHLKSQHLTQQKIILFDQ